MIHVRARHARRFSYAVVAAAFAAEVLVMLHRATQHEVLEATAMALTWFKDWTQQFVEHLVEDL